MGIQTVLPIYKKMYILLKIKNVIIDNDTSKEKDSNNFDLEYLNITAKCNILGKKCQEHEFKIKALMDEIDMLKSQQNK